MTDYRLRRATIADVEALVAHRVGMFTDMGVAIDAGGGLTVAPVDS